MIPAWGVLALALLATVALVYLLAHGLARTAAAADHQERHEARELAQASGHGTQRTDRFGGAEVGAPSTRSAPGRGDDVHPALLEARLALRFAEARLAKAEEQRIVDERRTGGADRRAVDRPWSKEAAGRRQGDALRREVLAAQQALREAETRLAAVEQRHAAGVRYR